MTLAAIDWFRAGADILGAFACAYVGEVGTAPEDVRREDVEAAGRWAADFPSDGRR